MKSILVTALTLFATQAFCQLQVSTVNVKANDLIYNPVTNRIYASIPSENGSNGNSIGVLNHINATLESTTYIGSEPTVLALSDNGQTLYTGFSASATIRKFDIATLTAGPQYPLGSDSFLGPYYANDIEVVPGQPDAVIVSRKYMNLTPSFAGVAIYDNGIPRQLISVRYGGQISNQIECKDATTVYGYCNETTGFNFNKLTVSNAGISLSETAGNMPSGYDFNLDFKYDDGRAYFTNGKVVNTATIPFLEGQFLNAFGPVVVDAGQKACFASFVSNNVIFKRFNKNNFLLVDALPIPAATAAAKNMVTCGPGCYAFTTGSKVFIIKDTALSANTISKPEVAVFPNPSADFITISGIDVESIMCYDANGKSFKLETKTNTVNIAHLNAGLYMARITDKNNNVFSKKIIKQ